MNCGSDLNVFVSISLNYSGTSTLYPTAQYARKKEITVLEANGHAYEDVNEVNVEAMSERY